VSFGDDCVPEVERTRAERTTVALELVGGDAALISALSIRLGLPPERVVAVALRRLTMPALLREPTCLREGRRA
jgi:hypothetical protein